MPSGVYAIKSFNRDAAHRGAQAVGEFHIFPEQRQGNVLYFKQKLITSDPEQTILDAYTTAPDIKSIVYLNRNAQGKLEPQYIDQSKAQKVKLLHIDQEFYRILDRATGRSKVFRIYKNRFNRILPNYKSTKGVVVSASNAALYHIRSSKPLPDFEGRPQREYLFHIHVVSRKGTKVRSFTDLGIQSTSAQLKLFWETDTILGYTTFNGETRYINTEEVTPKAKIAP